MRKSGFTTIELLVVIAVFGIVYFVAANKISYTFSTDYNTEIYKQTIASIETSAQIYGENNLKLFEEDKEVYVTVGELAKQNIVLANTEGTVNDPRDEKKTLNDMKIKLTYKKEKVFAKVLG